MKRKSCLFLMCVGVFFAQDVSKQPLLKSLIIPGWGNYSLGDKTAAYIHLGIELSAWVGYFYNDVQYRNAEKDFKSYARLKLNLMGKNYSDDFYSTIARYENYDQYIEYQKRQGNNLEKVYNESYAWDWIDEQNRLNYVLKRKESIDLDRKFKYFFVTMGLNRLISVLTTQKLRKNLRMKTTVKETAETGQQFSLNIHYSF